MGDVNAAVEGCLAAGATEVVVSDDTKFGINTIPEMLHPDVKLISGRGFGWPVPVLHGIDGSFTGVIMVGGIQKRELSEVFWAHTFTGRAASTGVLVQRS
jgi:D-amino peptidase